MRQLLASIFTLPLTAAIALALDPQTKVEIDELITFVQTSGVPFIRNGQEYCGAEGADHLRDKLAKAGDRVKRILSEIDLDMSRWPSEKHFCAWLNVAPNNRISGGKMLSSRRRKNANRALAALRLAARTPCKVKPTSAPLSDTSNRVLAHRQLSTPEPTNWLAWCIACSSSARPMSKPDSKPKSSSKNALYAAFSAKHANSASTSLPMASTALVS